VNGPIVNLAAYDGHLGVVKWGILSCAVSPQRSLTAATMNLAAAAGHLHVLKYLVMVGCPWDTDTTTAAVINGHLNVFEYAYENGYDYHQQSFYTAARAGHLSIIKYGYQHNIDVHRERYRSTRCCVDFRYADIICAISNAAVECGQLHILDWIAHEIGCPKNLHITTIMMNRVDSLEWLVKNDPAVDGRQLYCTAVQYYKIDILEWLYTNSVPGADIIRTTLLKYYRPDIKAWADSKGI
jgi:hypothetical protein